VASGAITTAAGRCARIAATRLTGRPAGAVSGSGRASDGDTVAAAADGPGGSVAAPRAGGTVAAAVMRVTAEAGDAAAGAVAGGATVGGTVFDTGPVAAGTPPTGVSEWVIGFDLILNVTFRFI